MIGRHALAFVLGVVIAGVLLAHMVTFQVKYSEKAVVETWGKPSPQPVGAGLHFRWPWPVQRVVKYDMRRQSFEDPFEQAQTNDNLDVLMSVYVCWQIEDPVKYRSAVGDSLDAGKQFIRSLIGDAKNNVIRSHPMSALVSVDPQAVRLADMVGEKGILGIAAPKAAAQYGIRIQSVGINRLGLPERITATVMENMRSERQLRAQSAVSQGRSTAQAIISDADSISQQILSFARLRAEQIKAQGEKEAEAYYRRYGSDEGFAMFLLQTEFLGESLKKNAEILLNESIESSFGYFRQPPTAEQVNAQGRQAPATAPATPGL